jgi:hypothetical protein
VKVDLEETSLNRERQDHLNAQRELSHMPKPDLHRRGRGTLFRFFTPVVSGLVLGDQSKPTPKPPERKVLPKVPYFFNTPKKCGQKRTRAWATKPEGQMGLEDF